MLTILIVDAIIQKLLSFKVSVDDQPTKVYYSPEAWEIVLEWIKRNTDAENDPNTTATEGGIRAKMDIYLHRFCLIIQLASYASGETSDRETISPQTARNAIKIANYFYLQAENKRIKERSELLPKNWKEVFDILPGNEMEFSTAEYLQRTKTMGIKERSAKEWLKNNSDRHGNKLFIKVKHGTYVKA